jgi:UrcA family protein
MSRTIHLMIAAALLAPTAVAAQSEQPTARVSYADLNLGTPAGLSTLDRRIQHAIDGMCGHAVSGNLDAAAPVWKCRSAAEASAASQRQLALQAAQQGSTIRIAVR